MSNNLSLAGPTLLARFCDLDSSHKLGPNALVKDPLGRTREVTRQDGSKQTETMKLCHNCYCKALGDKQTSEGKTCDLDSSHKLGSQTLKSDPLERTKEVTRQDGFKQTEIMKLCNSCYRKALVEKQTSEGKTCDLDSSHKLGSQSLRSDPLERTKEVILHDGSKQTEIMKLCYNCYRKALSGKKISEGQTCDLDSSHKLGSIRLTSDPLGRTKAVTRQDGSKQIETIKLCDSCYKKALLGKQTSEGKTCDLDSSHKLGFQGLIKDPLERTKEVTRHDGFKQIETMKLCQNCYNKALVEKHRSEGKTCDLDSSHKLGSQSLISDPLERTKEVIRQDGSKQTEIMKLCHNCYNKALKKKKAQKAQKVSPFSALVAVASSTLFEVKKESKDSEEEEEYDDVTLVKSTRYARNIDNSLPILQDPKDPTKSLLSIAERPIESIHCYDWNVLPETLNDKQKADITNQVHEWLKLNEKDRSAYQKKLEDLLEIKIPLDDGPERGLSVFAKQDIPKWTVVGPYAGVLRSDGNLQKAIRKQGSCNTLTYLFGTRSQKRTVDALSSGNVLSLANTGQLMGTSPWKDNNLASIGFGKNLNFYVSCTDIKKGDELTLDYGVTYNPYQLVKMEDPS